MTDEERKQFINEYCRNVGNTKIRCDDCKFVEDCVDYGWQECKKFTPKPSEPMTNEEWLRNLSFNELARVLYCMIINGERIRPDLAYIKRWLKQPHREE